MTDRLILADARRVSCAAFLEAIGPLFGKPTKADLQRQAEIAAALEDHQAAVQATYAIKKLWDQITARDALKVEYELRLLEIGARYAAQRAGSYVSISFKTLDDGREQVAA